MLIKDVFLYIRKSVSDTDELKNSETGTLKKEVKK